MSSTDIAPIYIIAAMTQEGIIGKQGRLPWHIPEELALFKKLTMGHTVIMGRKTFQSIGSPLDGRHNIVVSRIMPERTDLRVVRSVEEALAVAQQYQGIIFIIGGAEIFKETLLLADFMYISTIHGHYEGDVCFPPIDPQKWSLQETQTFKQFTLQLYARKPAA